MTLPLIASLNGKHYYSLPRKLFNYIELTGSQGPIGDGFVFSTKSDLQTAVDEWNTDSTSAEAEYGDISTWNVSAITDMSQLFLAKTTITELDLSDWDVSNVTDMRQMFVAMINCTSLDISGWDTDNVTDMSVMFGNMGKLESLDVSSLNTHNVTDMSSMFASTGKLTSLDVTNFDTSKVTNMANMFGGMAKLTSLDVTNFDTSKVTNMSQMFSQIPVSTLDLSSFDTSSVTSFRSFFYACKELTSIDLAHFDTNNVTDMAYMFWDTWKLDAIQGINDFDTDNVTVMYKMFARNGVAATTAELPTSSGLTSIDLSGWNVANVVATTPGGEEGFGNMFTDLTSLTDVGDLSNWCVENVTSEPTDFATNAPFANTPSNLPVWGTCPEPQGPTGDGFVFETKADLQTAVDEWASDSISATETYGDISTWNVSAITNMYNLFNGWNKANWNFTSLDLSNWDMSNKTDISQMFSNCPNLTSLNVVGWNVENVEQCYSLFYNCSGLETLDITGLSLPLVTNMNGMFNQCESLHTLIGYENLVQNSVNSIHGLFNNCKKLTSLDLSNWDVSEVSNMADTFGWCTLLETLTGVEEWNVGNVNIDQHGNNRMQAMFNKCYVLDLDLSNWCVENIPSTPPYFANYTLFGDTQSKLPVWGTCPDVPSPTPSPSVTLDSGPQGPTGDGHTFSTKADLQTAVDAWNTDSISATETYGDISTWNVSAITDMSVLFNNQQNITSLDLSGWDTSSVTNMSAMFNSCSSLTSITFGINFDTSDVEYMNGMFYECNNLISLDLSNFDTSSVTNMANMFSYCSSLTSITFGEIFSGDDMNWMFQNCSALTSLDLSSFDTSSVTGMTGMFVNCSALTSITFGDNFDTSDVTSMGFMFHNCSSLTSLDISGWCVTQIDYVPFRFTENAPFANDSNNLPVWGTCP